MQLNGRPNIRLPFYVIPHHGWWHFDGWESFGWAYGHPKSYHVTPPTSDTFNPIKLNPFGWIPWWPRFMCPAKKSYKIKYATAIPLPSAFMDTSPLGRQLAINVHQRTRTPGRTCGAGFLSAGMVNVRTIHTKSLKFEQVCSPAALRENSWVYGLWTTISSECMDVFFCLIRKMKYLKYI